MGGSILGEFFIKGWREVESCVLGVRLFGEFRVGGRR